MTASTLVTDYMGSGVLANRPTTPPITAGATAFYYATDTRAMYQWNGSAWQKMGWGADAAVVATLESTASTSFTDLATVGPAVTINTGTSVIAFMSVSGYNNSLGNTSFVGVAVSGATTLAASDANAMTASEYQGGGYWLQMSRVLLLTGLTAGSNIFTMKYRADGSTWNWKNRSLAILPI
jgi:hypothetical protein